MPSAHSLLKQLRLARSTFGAPAETLKRELLAGLSTRRLSTKSGAITRAFGVSSSASHASPMPSASTSFDTIACRYDGASGPTTPTKSRGRLATPVVT
jgi:hypothetical protein